MSAESICFSLHLDMYWYYVCLILSFPVYSGFCFDHEKLITEDRHHTSVRLICSPSVTFRYSNKHLFFDFIIKYVVTGWF